MRFGWFEIHWSRRPQPQPMWRSEMPKDVVVREFVKVLRNGREATPIPVKGRPGFFWLGTGEPEPLVYALERKVGDDGRAYRVAVLKAMAQRPSPKLAGRLAVHIDAYAPDGRRLDIDNRAKALLDALTHAGLWLDDEQIDDLRIVRKQPEQPGAVVVRVREL